jgi:excisionase family DNA binding protein
VAIEQHYTGRQVAEKLGLDYETVLRLAQTGEITTVRVGRRRLFPESAVNAYLAQNKDAGNGIVVDLHRRVVSPDEEAP